MTRSFKFDPQARDTQIPRWLPWIILMAIIAFCGVLLWLKNR
jgi:hypothetical protein